VTCRFGGQLALNLIAEGILPIKAGPAEEVRRYTESRGAVLADWHPESREMLIATRFGNTLPIHREAQPGGEPRRTTPRTMIALSIDAQVRTFSISGKQLLDFRSMRVQLTADEDERLGVRQRMTEEVDSRFHPRFVSSSPSALMPYPRDCSGPFVAGGGPFQSTGLFVVSLTALGRPRQPALGVDARSDYLAASFLSKAFRLLRPPSSHWP